ncbi:MAG: hypothetical protein QNJ97_23125 [Myxococcota bacterium]|nr:hypothetical protein [Myxococcota bacterium]
MKPKCNSWMWLLAVTLAGLLMGSACGDESDKTPEINDEINDDPIADAPIGYESLPLYHGGVDILVVVDNSNSMEQEQEILATGFFTLINALSKPVIGPDWPFPPIEDMRVAIVSSDMGLQYGDTGSIEDVPTDIGNCLERGDDGELSTNMPGTVSIASGVIACAEDGDQCPEDFICNNGFCDSPTPDELYPVPCPDLNTGNDFAETNTSDPNGNLATQVACMAQVGNQGCGIEQQLQAAVRGLTRQAQLGTDGFLVDSHLLAVLIVSDEEDCSIRDPGLFKTAEWESGTNPIPGDPESGRRNIACNFPVDNEIENLFDPSVYWDKFVTIKDDKPMAVIFAAIVGVPQEDVCQGRGSELDGCLDHDDMQFEPIEYESQGNLIKHFRPACSRIEGNALVTEARPGRRYVKIAQDFDKNGYIYSICNQDWSPALTNVSYMIGQGINPLECFSKTLQWTSVPDGCEGCGVAANEMYVKFEFPADTSMSDLTCPPELGASPDDIIVTKAEDPNGAGSIYEVYCPVPKLPAPVDCPSAVAMWMDSDKLGWYYCENPGEAFDSSCKARVKLSQSTRPVISGHLVIVADLAE